MIDGVHVAFHIVGHCFWSRTGGWTTGGWTPLPGGFSNIKQSQSQSCIVVTYLIYFHNVFSGYYKTK